MNAPIDTTGERATLFALLTQNGPNSLQSLGPSNLALKCAFIAGAKLVQMAPVERR